MSLELKPRLSQYFEATNAHRADDTFRKFALHVIHSDVRQEDDVTLVRTQVAGAFIGSPIRQLYRFKTSENAIEELLI